MVFQAQNFADIQAETAALSKIAGKGTEKEIEALREAVRQKYNGLAISKEMAGVLAKDPKAMEDFVKQQGLSLEIAKSKTVFDQVAYEKRKKTLEAERDILKADLAVAENARMNAKTDEERAAAEKTAEATRLQLRGKRQQLADLEGKGLSQKKETEKQKLRDEISLLNDDLKTAGEEGKTKLAGELQAKIESKTKKLEDLEKAPDKNLETIEDINKSLLKAFEGYAMVTGKSLQALATEYSTLGNLALLTSVVGGLGLILHRMGGMTKIMDVLAKHSANKRGKEGQMLKRIDQEDRGQVGDLGKDKGTTKEQRAERRAKKAKAMGAAKTKKPGLLKRARSALTGKGAMGGLGKLAKVGGIVGTGMMIMNNGPELLDAIKGLSEGKFAESIANLAPTVGSAVGGFAGAAVGGLTTMGLGSIAGGMGGAYLGEKGGDYLKDFITEKFINKKPEEAAKTPSTIDKNVVIMQAAKEAAKPTPINMATVTPQSLSAAQQSMQGMNTPQSTTSSTSSGGQTGTGTGSFGAISPDGAGMFKVDITIPNMMDAYASAYSLAKKVSK